MSRTKKQAAPDVFDAAIAAQQEAAPAEQLVTGTSEQPASGQMLQEAMAETYPAPQTAMATDHERPSTSPDQPANGQPERQWQKKAAVAVDKAAGVKLNFDYEKHTAIIEFADGKPSDSVRTAIKNAGFHWRQPDKESLTWQKKINFSTREQDRSAAFGTFNKVADMLREEKGVTQTR